MGESRRRPCIVTLANGEPCKQPANRTGELCKWHDEASAMNRAKAGRLVVSAGCRTLVGVGHTADDESDLELSGFCFDGEHRFCVNGPGSDYGWCRCPCHAEV